MIEKFIKISKNKIPYTIKGDLETTLEVADGTEELVMTNNVAPVVHGHWIICSDGYYPYCSVCKCEPKGREMTKFCGECGAKMDEE